MKLSLFGCGSIGQRHATNLKDLGYGVIQVFDIDIKRRNDLSKKIGAIPINDPKAAMLDSDVAFICTPPNAHTDLIESAVEAGVHVFVEKPISNVESKLPNILKLADEKNLKIMVGYMLKFHPAFIKMKELVQRGQIGRILNVQAHFGYLLPKWRPEADYRKNYFTQHESGGGILLDASHEIDYIRWIFGEPKSVYCKISHLSDLKIETEDHAIIVFESQSGQIIEIHLDCLDYKYNRFCKVIGTDGSLTCNFNGKVVVINEQGIQEFQEPFNLNDLYKNQIKYFIESISENKKIINDGWSGLRTLELVSQAKFSATSGKTLYTKAGRLGSS
mgnify:FL=1